MQIQMDSHARTYSQTYTYTHRHTYTQIHTMNHKYILFFFNTLYTYFDISCQLETVQLLLTLLLFSAPSSTAKGLKIKLVVILLRPEWQAAG